jgi:hypothetical protein
LYIYKPNNIITSILPRQEERREAEESERGVSGVERRGRKRESEEEVRGHTQESTSEREYEVDA